VVEDYSRRGADVDMGIESDDGIRAVARIRVVMFDAPLIRFGC
jgi:hypothetical protein